MREIVVELEGEGTAALLPGERHLSLWSAHPAHPETERRVGSLIVPQDWLEDLESLTATIAAAYPEKLRFIWRENGVTRPMRGADSAVLRAVRLASRAADWFRPKKPALHA